MREGSDDDRGARIRGKQRSHQNGRSFFRSALLRRAAPQIRFAEAGCLLDIIFEFLPT